MGVRVLKNHEVIEECNEIPQIFTAFALKEMLHDVVENGGLQLFPLFKLFLVVDDVVVDGVEVMWG